MSLYSKIKNIIIARHKSFWSRKSTRLNVLLSLLLLVVSLVFNYGANIYAANHISSSVSDILLDNLPILNVSIIFLDGSLLFFIFVVILLLYEPNKSPFILKTLALFVLVRSIFIAMTHLGQPLQQYPINESDIFQKITSGDDLFFSGHTGLPYLMALIFWDKEHLRLIFLATSIIFGFTVLLGHLHYSIDVFAAFFITYGIFNLSKKFFRKDYDLCISPALYPEAKRG